MGDVEFKPRDLGSDRGYRVASIDYRGVDRLRRRRSIIAVSIDCFDVVMT
jgi:hypothetical protein